MHLAEYRKTNAMLADFLPWAALAAQGVILNKDGSLQRTARFPRPRPRQRHAGRAGRRVGPAQQRAPPPRLGLGRVRRGAAQRGVRLPAIELSRSRVVAGRLRAPGAVRGGRRPLRERLLPDLPVSAAGRAGVARRGLAVREPRPRGGRRRARGAARLRRPHRPRAATGRGLRAGGGVALRRRDADLPALDRLDQAAPRARAGGADAPRRDPGRRAADRRASSRASAARTCAR